MHVHVLFYSIIHLMAYKYNIALDIVISYNQQGTLLVDF